MRSRKPIVLAAIAFFCFPLCSCGWFGEENTHRHNMETIDIEPTCTSQGVYNLRYCTSCGYVAEGNYTTIPALGHEIVETYAIEQTCVSYAWEYTNYCTRCGTYEERTALTYIYGDHVYEYSTLEPTCTEQGSNRLATCKNCQKTVNEDPIDPLGHDLTFFESEDGDCTEKGIRGGYRCTRCDYVHRGESYSSGEHEIVKIAAKEATCTEDGHNEYDLCLSCGFSTMEAIPALGHEDEKIPGKAADCVAPGFTDHTQCSRCGTKTGYSQIPALGHDWASITRVEPTCTDQGYVSYRKCSRCNVDEGFETILPLGHDYVHSTACSRCDAALDYGETISTYEELLAIADDPEGVYTLEADIDCQGQSLVIADSFSGHIYGNDHKISNFTLSTTNAEDFGIFKSNSGTIYNLALDGFSVSSDVDKNNAKVALGILAARNSGTIEKVDVGSSTGNNSVMQKFRTLVPANSGSSENYFSFGAVAGVNSGSIIDCSSSFNVNNGGEGGSQLQSDHYHKDAENRGYYNYGGIAGLNEGYVDGCVSSTSFSNQLLSYGGVGSLSWYNTYSYAYGLIGGIVGQNTGSMENCLYSGGSLECVKGTREQYGYVASWIGGLAGYNLGSISASEADNAIVKDLPGDDQRLGGLVGNNAAEGRIINCLAKDTQVIESTDDKEKLEASIGGFAGYNAGAIANSLVIGSLEYGYTDINDGDLKDHIGGFAGKNAATGIIRQSACSVDVGSYNNHVDFGRFVGLDEGGSLALSYYSSDKKAVYYVLKSDGTYAKPNLDANNDLGSSTTSSELLSETFLKDSLGLDPSIWNLTGNNPSIKQKEQQSV